MHDSPTISLLNHRLLSPSSNLDSLPQNQNNPSTLWNHQQSQASNNTNPPQLSLPPNLSVTRCKLHHIPSFRRINSLLLPIRYPDSFYNAIVSDPTVNDLTRLAIWQDGSGVSNTGTSSRRAEPSSVRVADRSQESAVVASAAPQIPQPQSNITGKVIGGVRCRIEPHGPPPVPSSTSISSNASGHRKSSSLYIQTLALLSPYRGLGIATALLHAVIESAVQDHSANEVYAHVWEANEDALRWYERRGFEVGEEVLQGYYTKLKPGGARLVRKVVG